MDMMEESQRKNSIVLNKILQNCFPKDGKWIKCPTCKREWSKLTPSGVCVECEERSCDC